MKKFAAAALAAVFALMPAAASAHQHEVYEIGGRMYEIGVGSLNEPLVVDDKSGVELEVMDLGKHVEGMPHADGAGTPVEGLEEALKVELIAGSAKKTLDFSPIFGEAGSYKAPFYPTVATTLSYRVFGELNGTPVSLTFTCNPAGHAVAPDDDTEVEISEGVTRHEKAGAFGCPVEKPMMGFPEESADVLALKDKGASAGGMATTALALAAVALVGAGLAMRRSKAQA